MKSDTGATGEGDVHGTTRDVKHDATGETASDAARDVEHDATGKTANDEDAATPLTICFVCQQPISETVEELPRGEPAHLDCAAEHRAALSQRTRGGN